MQEILQVYLFQAEGHGVRVQAREIEESLGVFDLALFRNVPQDRQSAVLQRGGPDLDNPVPRPCLGLGDRAGEAAFGEDLLQTLVEGGVGALEKLASTRIEEGGVEVPVHADDRVCHPVEYRLATSLLLLGLPEGSLEGGGHRVERLAQGADLVLNAGRDAFVEVAGGQAAGGDVEAVKAARE